MILNPVIYTVYSRIWIISEIAHAVAVAVLAFVGSVVAIRIRAWAEDIECIIDAVHVAIGHDTR